MLIRTITKGCGARLMLGGRGDIFGQCMGSVPAQHREKFGWLLIFSDNPVLENQKRQVDYMVILLLDWVNDFSLLFTDNSVGRP